MIIVTATEFCPVNGDRRLVGHPIVDSAAALGRLLLNKAIPIFLLAALAAQAAMPPQLKGSIAKACHGCHAGRSAMGGLDLAAFPFDLAEPSNRERWIRIYDRIEKHEMPPKGVELPPMRRARILRQLASAIRGADRLEVSRLGRGPMRRLNRDEYEQNLRDVLLLPDLDIRDMLPEDREAHHFNKAGETLDISHIQMAAYLDAAEEALRQAMASGTRPPPATSFRAVGAALFPAKETFGEREAMFFAKDGKAITASQLEASPDDPAMEMALFRSAHWPYFGYPKGFIAKLPGWYRLRFSARAVVQLDGYVLKPAAQPVPMTFRARKPSGPDVSGDVRATGGIIDIQPDARVFETTIRLREHETFEYSLLGLPVPLARNLNGGPPTYRYPPFPEGGQPGVAVQWLEVEGPLSRPEWPPLSHRVLFDELGANPVSTQPEPDARRLLRRFIDRAAHAPVPDRALQTFERLILERLGKGAPFSTAMLAGYKAFLCSPYFLYLREPGDHFAIASRLSHFLANTRPDEPLLANARARRLRDPETLRAETLRLIDSSGFQRFVGNFTSYWLNLRHLRRDDPDIRLYPEYRFDDYLVESMALETRAFFTALIREKLPARNLVDADFIFANDRLAKHYQLPPLSGSAIRKVLLPPESPLGGLLTQAAILKVTSNGTTTSPVVRGAWIMDRIIGEPPPPPPAGVPTVEPDTRGARTIRDILAMHTKDASCAACHARFDPVGFAMENFDILGGWRSRYRGMEQGERVSGIDRAGHDFSYTLADRIDASGKLLDGRTFRNVRELKNHLAANPRQLARNLLHQFTIYSTGSPVRFSERVPIEAMLDDCAKNGYRVRDLLLALVQSEIFLGQP